MKAPLNWLKDFVDIDIAPAELEKKFVSAGFEIEEIINQRDAVKNTVAGQITAIEKHPNADKLFVCTVDVGFKVVQIVTNAKNVYAGAVVPVALDGALLPSGTKISAGELRGVRSDGMFTGLEELKATDEDFPGADPDGVLILSPSIAPGTDIADVLGLDDIIFDVSVTANRPDCNSILGIAREIAAVTGKDVKPYAFTYQSDEEPADPVKVVVENQILCPRYMAQTVKNVKIKPSPEYIKKRLKAVGIRPINNIVDITNYVLTEIGQPMHAFDRFNIGGNHIIVRNAKKDEEVVTLDGKTRTLEESVLVICDLARPMAVAGIMGGTDSGINVGTVEIVFESAKFARDNIRRSSKALNLRSDSSARFEKGIDFSAQELGLKRALQLVHELECGTVAGAPVDIATDFVKERTVSFTAAAVSKILGITVKADKIMEILNGLGIKTVQSGKLLTSDIPEYREDLENANDIAEEVIRLMGYDKIKSKLLSKAQQTIGGASNSYRTDTAARNAAAGAGFSETVTYSFISPKAFDLLRLSADDALRNAVGIRNPLGEDVSIMRTVILPSALAVVASNISKFNKEARFFEIAKRYSPKAATVKTASKAAKNTKIPSQAELPVEEQTLVLTAYGEGESFFTLKGALDRIAGLLGLEFSYRAKVYPFLHDGRSAEVLFNGVHIGYIGEVHPETQDAYGSPFRIYAAEISLEKLYDKALEVKKFASLPKFPGVARDLAVVVEDGTSAAELIAVIKKTAKLLESIGVFDVYKGTHIAEGFKSIAFGLTFRHPERTLTDDEIAEEMTVVLAALKKGFGAELRK
ncbi:MAG: phenylalanine--tRNA ligase subunit beta [Clostridiaceae bacterium]|jgi:phenylalanyl-tRNA synthetase beta chain|nr:phenylalanine--tRNA ligase subunit beta [Clostridiaceae bacterium]